MKIPVVSKKVSTITAVFCLAVVLLRGNLFTIIGGLTALFSGLVLISNFWPKSKKPEQS